MLFRSLEKEAQDIQSRLKLKDTIFKQNLPGIIEQYNIPEVKGTFYGTNPPGVKDVREALGNRLEQIRQEQRQLLGGVGRSQGAPSTQPPPSGKIKMKHTKSGAIRELTADEYNKLMSRPDANEFEKI